MQQRKGKTQRPKETVEQKHIQLNQTRTNPGPTKSGKYIGFMCPSGVSLKHPMAELLLDYAENGCNINCGEHWSSERIEAAIK